MDKIEPKTLELLSPKPDSKGLISWFDSKLFLYGLWFTGVLAFFYNMRYRAAFPYVFPGSQPNVDRAKLDLIFNTQPIWIPEDFKEGDHFANSSENSDLYISNFLGQKPNSFMALWFTPLQDRATHTVLYFHGSNTDVYGDIRELYSLANDYNCNVISIEYPKYGLMADYKFHSHPAVSIHKVINKWAQSAYKFLRSMNLRSTSITLLGYSLGTGPALELAANIHESGETLNSVALFAPYTSIKDVAKSILFYTEPFVFQYWDNMAQIHRLNDANLPLIIEHSKADRAIPFWQGEKLFNAYTGPKVKIFSETGSHMFNTNNIAAELRMLWEADNNK